MLIDREKGEVKKRECQLFKHPELLGKATNFGENSRYRRRDSNGIHVVYTNTVACYAKPAITSLNNPAALITLLLTKSKT
jgi:hypothetical protein